MIILLIFYIPVIYTVFGNNLQDDRQAKLREYNDIHLRVSFKAFTAEYFKCVEL